MLKNNLDFPYPVLLSEPKHFKKSTLRFKALVEINNFDLNLTYNFQLNCNYINGLIESKLCKTYIIVESKYSMYRELFEITKYNIDTNLTLNIENIHKKLTITPVIVATSNILNYNSKEFKYSDITYEVKKNEIVGFCEPIELFVDNYSSIFQSLANVITVRYNDRKSNRYTYSLDDDMIVITFYNKKHYEEIQQLNMKSQFLHTMYQGIIFPILIDALLNISNSKYEDYRWARLLNNKLTISNQNVPTDYKKAFTIAQEILEHPAAKMIDELYVVGGKDE